MKKRQHGCLLACKLDWLSMQERNGGECFFIHPKQQTAVHAVAIYCFCRNRMSCFFHTDLFFHLHYSTFSDPIFQFTTNTKTERLSTARSTSSNTFATKRNFYNITPFRCKKNRTYVLPISQTLEYNLSLDNITGETKTRELSVLANCCRSEEKFHLKFAVVGAFEDGSKK